MSESDEGDEDEDDMNVIIALMLFLCSLAKVLLPVRENRSLYIHQFCHSQSLCHLYVVIVNVLIDRIRQWIFTLTWVCGAGCCISLHNANNKVTSLAIIRPLTILYTKPL